MQYFVIILSIVCFAKNVFVKSIKSGIMRFLESAQYEVNSKLLLVLPFFCAAEAFASLTALNRVLFE